MIVFDPQKRIPIVVKGRTLRFQQDTQCFLEDSQYYFQLPASHLESLMSNQGEDDNAPSPMYFC